MLKKLLASSFFILTALVNPSFAGGDGCYGGGADVNDSQKTDTRETEA